MLRASHTTRGAVSPDSRVPGSRCARAEYRLGRPGLADDEGHDPTCPAVGTTFDAIVSGTGELRSRIARAPVPCPGAEGAPGSPRHTTAPSSTTAGRARTRTGARRSL